MTNTKKKTYRFTLLLAAIVASGCASGGGGSAGVLSNIGNFKPSGLSSMGGAIPGGSQFNQNPKSSSLNNQVLPGNGQANPASNFALADDSFESGFGLTSGGPVPYRAVSSGGLEPLDGGKIYGHY